MWALGLLLYNLLFDAQFCDSNKIVQMKREYFLTDEMINNSNPAFIQLIEMLLKMNPKNRISADDVLVFIDKNWEKNEEVCVLKRRFSLINKISETTAINYFSCVALKTLFSLHCYLLYGPPEVITVEFKTEEFLNSLLNLWKQRFEKNTYDEDVIRLLT